MRVARGRLTLESFPALRYRDRELALSFPAIIQNFASGCNLFDDATMSAQLSDYDYDLPRELIARRPLVRREDSRMMVLHRAGQTIEHRQFREVKTFLQPGDLLVLN